MTSMLTGRRTLCGCASSQSDAALFSRMSFCGVTASTGVPNSMHLRVYYFDNSCMRFPAVFVWRDRYYVEFPVSAGPVTVKDHVTMFPQIGTGDIFSITSELMRRHRSYWAVRGPFAVLCRIYRLIVRLLQYWLSHTSTSPQFRQPRRIKTVMWSNREHASKTVNLVCVSISGKV